MKYVEVSRQAPPLRAEIDAATLARLLRVACGAQTGLAQHALIGSGHFNTSYALTLADGRRVLLRAAPLARPGVPLWRHERALLQRQCAVQPMLATLGEVVPELIHADFSRQHIERDWAVFAWREGCVWHEVAPQLPAAQQDSLWRQYGALVARLHALRGPTFGFPAPRAAHARFSDWFLEVINDLAADLAEQGIAVAGLPQLIELLHEGRAQLDAVGEPRLVHGDLWQRNVLVAPRGEGWQITALLDAERAFWGDPAAEWIFGFLDIPAAFWSAYGRSYAAPEGDALWRRRAYQARGALHMLLEGRRFGFDAGFAHEQFARHLHDLTQLSRAPAPVN